MNASEQTFNSAIYSGKVRHRRFSPKHHAFEYQVFMPWLDLDEIDELFKLCRFWSAEKFNLASFCRRDFADKPDINLKQRIISIAEKESGALTTDKANKIDKVFLLANLRYFGFSFNPISTYYCYNRQQQLICTVAEVTNTPWHERHFYTIPNPQPSAQKVAHRFKKDFHVSPFLDMDYTYHWYSNAPDKKLYIHMENYQQGDKVFDASLSMQREALTPATLDKKILAFPFMSLKVVAGIYWQALKLYLKKVPIYDHPKNNTLDIHSTVNRQEPYHE